MAMSPEEPKLPITPRATAAKQHQVPQHQVQHEITLAEPSISPFDVALCPRDELPIVQSLDWQLQYPPGGSTHPAYPWPPADPRLIFQDHFVPLRGGLPDVSQLLSLNVPIGWQHVSWSGLYPVVFDPHHQAFKLTPIGPLPLTSEELHQGGLQKYVPGGSHHPEAGLLPLLLEFTDGSEADVFNFGGVDWTLPWADYNAIPIDTNTVNQDASNPLSHSVSTVSLTPPHYLESRDCPDGIIDLEQAWTWMSEREKGSTIAFVPAPGKTWRGSGVHQTSRKFKQPIASLMAITMSENEEINREGYLGKQDKREFCAFKSVATPVHVDITLLQDVEFTLVEFLSYFPSHCQWRKGGDRLARSDLTASEIANFVNMVRRLPATSLRLKNTIEGQLWWETLKDGSRIRIQRSGCMVNYTAEQWTYNVWEKTDYPLLALAHGLLELPSGPDAGPLTAIVKWCRENNRHKAMLSEAPALLKEANIDTLIDPGDDLDPDKEVITRYAEALRADRKRVLKERKELDVGEERKAKKRKLM